MAVPESAACNPFLTRFACAILSNPLYSHMQNGFIGKLQNQVMVIWNEVK